MNMAKKKTNEQFIEEIKVKNPNIMPLEPYINARKPIQFKCSICGNIWKGIPNNVLRGEGCSVCANNRAFSTEEFINRLSAINQNITIVGKYINSKTPIRYVCKICGTENEAFPYSLLRGHGCNNCARVLRSKKRSKTDEKFRDELKSINPMIETISPYTKRNIPLRCQCRMCGYVFYATPGALLSGKKCDQCKIGRASLIKSNTAFLSELAKKNPNIEPLEEYKGASAKIYFECKECGNIWPSRPQQLLRWQGCPKCQKRWQTSFPEQAIFYYIQKKYADAINSFKSGFGQSEIDIYIPSINVGIEYDGRNWHKGNGEKEIKKYEICKRNNIFLIRIVERKNEYSLDQACDHYIESLYGNTKRFADLDSCIYNLFSFLSVSIDIDTDRDQYSIKNQYYARKKMDALESSFPEVSSEWYQPLNGKIKPYMISPMSSESFYWKCQKCGYIYPSIVSNRTKGHGCPKCANVERKTNEQYIEELNKINPNIQLIDPYTNTTTPVRYFCHTCGASGSVLPKNLIKREGCPFCHRREAAKKKALPIEEFINRANKLYPSIEFNGQYENSQSIIECKCRKCGNVWMARANSILSKNTGCSKCAGIKSKKVICIETNVIYESIHQAEVITKISHATISNCCNGKAFTAGGYHWRFAE